LVVRVILSVTTPLCLSRLILEGTPEVDPCLFVRWFKLQHLFEASDCFDKSPLTGKRAAKVIQFWGTTRSELQRMTAVFLGFLEAAGVQANKSQ
jgi:hypothetical protein